MFDILKLPKCKENCFFSDIPNDSRGVIGASYEERPVSRPITDVHIVFVANQLVRFRAQPTLVFQLPDIHLNVLNNYLHVQIFYVTFYTRYVFYIFFRNTVVTFFMV